MTPSGQDSPVNVARVRLLDLRTTRATLLREFLCAPIGKRDPRNRALVPSHTGAGSAHLGRTDEPGEKLGGIAHDRRLGVGRPAKLRPFGRAARRAGRAAAAPSHARCHCVFD
jgi:hypothetical protein